jgi:hypothetical protein
VSETITFDKIQYYSTLSQLRFLASTRKQLSISRQTQTSREASWVGSVGLTM